MWLIRWFGGNNMVLYLKFRYLILYVHIFLIKIFRKNYVRLKGSITLYPRSSIEISKNSSLVLGRGLQMRAHSLIAVRENSKLFIGDNVFINRNTIITSRESIVIKDGVTIGPNVCIYDHDHSISNRGQYVTKPIVVGENVWIGANVIILKGVEIGANSVIASGSIVTKNLPKDSILIQKRDSFIQQI